MAEVKIAVIGSVNSRASSLSLAQEDGLESSMTNTNTVQEVKSSCPFVQ